LILAHAANGDVGQAITAAEKAKSQGVTPAAWYNDQDLGPILRDDAFRVFRERFPEPKEQETGE
jgi:hypothetical protein